MADYDCIVIGAGIIGSATAYHLAKSGAKTLLLEQFPLGHSRGSSHGHSRTLRRAYKQPHYTKMVDDSIPQWRHLERETGVEIFKQTGWVSVGLDKNRVKGIKDNLTSLGIPYTTISRKQLAKDFPMMTLSNEAEGFRDDVGGVLFSDNALNAYQSVFKKHGGILRDAEKVLNIEPGEIVTVVTNRGRSYRTKKVVITAGPWAGKLLKPLGLQLNIKPIKAEFRYWKQKIPGMFDIERFPLFRFHEAVEGHGISLIPCYEYPDLIKILVHHSGKECDPDDRDLDPGTLDTQVVEMLGKFIREHVPQLMDKPSITEPCFYMWTPDNEYILDTHPRWQNIVIGTGFSGHGFKNAPVVGQILCELANDKKPNRDMSPFSIARHVKLHARL